MAKTLCTIDVLQHFTLPAAVAVVVTFAHLVSVCIFSWVVYGYISRFNLAFGGETSYSCQRITG